MRRTVITAVMALVAALSGATVRAQDAGCPGNPDIGPVEVTPADGAAGVPRNAIVRVRYSADYFAGTTIPTETITLTKTGGGSVPGTLQLVGTDTLYFVPSTQLDASAHYDGTASGAAFPFAFSFTTASFTDVARPDLRQPNDATGFAIESAPADTACSPVGSRRVRLSFPSATDDGPESSLEYWVYLTRGDHVAAPTLLTRVRDYGADVTTLGFVLTPVHAAKAVCVSVVAVDGLDRTSEWAAPVCFDPLHASGFVGLCSASSFRGHRSMAWAFGALVVGVTVRRRRRAAVLSR